jgi:hypothetical protein
VRENGGKAPARPQAQNRRDDGRGREGNSRRAMAGCERRVSAMAEVAAQKGAGVGAGAKGSGEGAEQGEGQTQFAGCAYPTAECPAWLGG